MPVHHAVVPVAGLGTRMLPLSHAIPKEMLPVGRAPVIQWVVEELARNAFDQILLVTSRGKNAIEEHFDLSPELTEKLRGAGKSETVRVLDELMARVQIVATRQRQQRGLGDAILNGETWTQREPFAVALGDSVMGRLGESAVLSQMRAIYERESCAAVVAFGEVEAGEVHRYGIAAPAGNTDGEWFALRDLIEKPSREEAPSGLAIMGRYIFSPAIYDALRETKAGANGEIQLTDAMRLLIQNGERVLGVVLPPGEKRFDIGNFEGYYKAFVEFSFADPIHGAALREYARKLLEDN